MRRISGLASVVLANSIGCGVADWSRQDLLACASPNGTTVAVFFRELAGGAAGSQDQHVILRRADSAEEHLAFGMGHGYDVVLEWTNDDALVIHYPEEANVYNWRERFNVTVVGRAKTVEVTLSQKAARYGSFVDDTSRCAGGGRSIPVDDAIRPIDRPTR
jgi:hypothetical protein